MTPYQVLWIHSPCFKLVRDKKAHGTSLLTIAFILVSHKVRIADHPLMTKFTGFWDDHYRTISSNIPIIVVFNYNQSLLILQQAPETLRGKYVPHTRRWNRVGQWVLGRVKKYSIIQELLKTAKCWKQLCDNVLAFPYSVK